MSEMLNLTEGSVQYLEDAHPNSEIGIDVEVSGGNRADIVVDRDIGENFAYNVIADLEKSQEGLKEALSYKLDGYQPVIIADIDLNRAMKENTLESFLCSQCSISDVGLLGYDEEDTGYVLVPSSNGI